MINWIRAVVKKSKNCSKWPKNVEQSRVEQSQFEQSQFEQSQFEKFTPLREYPKKEF
jgi:hypothetical protein